jgi:hypothetical protein
MYPALVLAANASDPTNKTLSHSFVEPPDMMNIYNGNVTRMRKVWRGPCEIADFQLPINQSGIFGDAIDAESSEAI